MQIFDLCTIAVFTTHMQLVFECRHGMKITLISFLVACTHIIAIYITCCLAISQISHVTTFGSKITADGDYSHEIKRCLLLGRKAITNLDSILKSRDITLPTKVRLFKAMVLPVDMYVCENWTLKKSEHQRIDAFTLWCWRRLLRVHWTAGRSNQSILKEISTEYSFEGRILKLKLQYFVQLMQRTD